KGSSKPGEGSNIFIFGHSSFYFWSPGDYKEVFRHLDELQNDDEIIIWYNQKEYKYKISESKVVYPDEVDVIKPTKEEQVSLMTCVPPGTTLKRLIVIGKLE
ncbi:MAG: putative sortase, partial [Candidatus Berkelbacteria bacterium]|nr:putative sortase [Candidatus Berkelbacteria bacterium]